MLLKALRCDINLLTIYNLVSLEMEGHKQEKPIFQTVYDF